MDNIENDKLNFQGGMRYALDKVYQWLKENYEDIGIWYIRGYNAEDLIAQLKQEMSKYNEIIH